MDHMLLLRETSRNKKSSFPVKLSIYLSNVGSGTKQSPVPPALELLRGAARTSPVEWVSP